jgi:hypothetical protein
MRNSNVTSFPDLCKCPNVAVKDRVDKKKKSLKRKNRKRGKNKRKEVVLDTRSSYSYSLATDEQPPTTEPSARLKPSYSYDVNVEDNSWRTTLGRSNQAPRETQSN